MNLWQRIAVVAGVAAVLVAVVVAYQDVDTTVQQAARPPGITCPYVLSRGAPPANATPAERVQYFNCLSGAGVADPRSFTPPQKVTLQCGSVFSTKNSSPPCEVAVHDRRNLSLAVGIGGLFVAVAGGLLLSVADDTELRKRLNLGS